MYNTIELYYLGGLFMVFSIVSIVVLVFIVWGMSYVLRNSDKRIEKIEEQRERDYLWFTTR